MSDGLILALIICGFVLTALALVAMVYLLVTLKRRNALYKKLDYLVEDVTYKLEVINPLVETSAKLANYIDAFEMVTRKSIAATVRFSARNRDDIYKLLARLRRFLLGPEGTSPAVSPQAKPPRASSKKSSKEKNAR